MTATKAPPASRAPLCAGLVGSSALHVALFAVAAAIPAGIVAARGGPDEPGVALTITLAPPSDETPIVVAVETTVAASHVPESQPETIELPDWPPAETALDAVVVPEGPATPPCDADIRPTPPDWRRLGELASLRPGPGAEGPRGGGTLGVGGSGESYAADGGARGAAIGSIGGRGTGDGADGAGDGWAPQRGATRGPAVVAPLPAPPYPPKARSRGWEGRVVLVLAIDENGRVTSAEVAESSGRSALDDAAREAAADWTFAPALRDGEPVAGTLRVPVKFELTE